MVGRDTCQVWWAALTDTWSQHDNLLDPVERDRLGRYARTADRDRFALGVVLSRLVLASYLGVAPDAIPICRDCYRCGKPHGRPRVVDSGLDFSVSHSGELVAVAVAPQHDAGRTRAVGIDVEETERRLEPEVAALVLAAAELAEYEDLPEQERPEAFFRYWVRKEAILKATGLGLAVPPSAITVSAAWQAPRLLTWAGPSEAAPDAVHLHDLTGHPGYAASVAVVGPAATVTECGASMLLTPA